MILALTMMTGLLSVKLLSIVFRDCGRIMKANNWIEFCRTTPEKTSVSNLKTLGFCETKDFTDPDEPPRQKTL
jgi:hypothetical protein